MPISDGVIKPLRRGGNTRNHVEYYFGRRCDGSSLTTASAPILGRVTFHRRVIEALVNVLADIEAAGKAQLIDLVDYRRAGGTYNCRRVGHRARGAWSPHAWGIAIDLQPHELFINGQVVSHRSRINYRCKQSEVSPRLRELAPFFHAWGFSWGGHWNPRYLDPMHFEATELTVAKLEQPRPERPLLLQRADCDLACPMHRVGDRMAVWVRDLEGLGIEVHAEHLERDKKVYVVLPGGAA